VVAIGSVLIAVEQRAFDWYTWTTLVVFLIGIVSLLLEVPPAKNLAYGRFYNWLAGARRRSGRRYAIVALWGVVLMEQAAMVMKHDTWIGAGGGSPWPRLFFSAFSGHYRSAGQCPRQISSSHHSPRILSGQHRRILSPYLRKTRSCIFLYLQ
jgi:hypothetical protein